MHEFVTSTTETKDITDEDVLEFVLDGRPIGILKPQSGTMAIMLSLTRGTQVDHQKASTFISMMFNLFETDEDRQHIEDRMMDPRDPFDLSAKGGLMEIFEWVLKETGGDRPPLEPSDYQPSRKATGRASTASTRAKASTSSPSRSRASSRSSSTG